MKTIIATCLMMGLFTLSMRAQSACEINDVHTNPDPQYVKPAQSSGQPAYRTNHFNWRAPYWPIGWTERETSFNVPAPPGANYKYIENPFYAPIPWMGYLAKEGLSDFQPHDGWELVSMDFGMENSSEPIMRPISFLEPHLLMYNKYTSILRLLLPLVDDDDGTFTRISLVLEARSVVQKDASGLFAGTGGVLNPLDTKSPTRTVTSRVKALDLPFLWNHVETPVFYDPCSCTRDQILRTEFESITKGTIKLYGLYAGTGTSLVAETDPRALPYPSGFQDPQAYLASLDGRYLETNLRPGSIVAKDLNALADNYNQWAKAITNLNQELNAASKNLELLGEGLDVLSVYFSMFSDTTGATAAAKGNPAGLKAAAVAKALKLLSVASKFASKLAKPKGNLINPEHYLPSYTQGEIMLNGSFSSSTELSATTQQIALPGTPWTKDDNLVAPFVTATKPQYPLYNETLGLFAILHAPKVTVSSGTSEVVSDEEPQPPGSGSKTDKARRRSWRQYKFGDTLDYVWNPASHVDVENTRINAALIVKQSVGGAANGFTTPCSQWYDVAPDNGERLYDTDLSGDGEPTSSVYASEFVGLECLTEIPLTLHRAQYCPTLNSPNGTGQFRSTDTVFVRLVMDVRFKPNEYGVRNRSLMIYTLPVNLVSEDDTLTGSGMPTYDMDFNATGAISHVATYKKQVTRTITITDADISTAVPVSAEYLAGSEVVVRGESVVRPETRLAIEFGVSCGKPRIAPYSGDINAFCTSSQYKAKEIADAVIAGDEQSDPLEKWSRDHQLRARLETGQQQLDVVSEATEDPTVVVQVYDVIGNLVAVGEGYKSAEPLTRTTVPMNGVPAGAYVVIATSGGKSTTFKILYAP